MKKRITLIGLNFYPEDTAIGLYSTQLVKHLQKNDFEVTVLTGFPYYPMWKINKDYQNKPKNYTETVDGIKIIRYKQYIPENPTFIKRILLLLDFTFGVYKNSFKVKKTDLVVTIVPFTSAVLAGNKLAKRKKAKHWVHIQDFEFDAAYQTDLTKNKKYLFKFLFRLEKKLLNKADSVSTISNAMLRKLKSKINKNTPAYLLPNWVDVSNINPSNYKKHPYLSSNKYKILYSGNIGEKQDWNLFLKVAENINDKDVEFIVVGNGAKKDWLVKQIEQLNNVKYYAPVPYKELSDLLCSADLHILFQKNNVVDTVMPSKILGMMASAKPSLITGNSKSEVASVMQESNGGIYLHTQNYSDVVKSIKTVKDSQDNFGENARKYVKKHFSSDRILNQFTERFNLLLQK